MKRTMTAAVKCVLLTVFPALLFLAGCNDAEVALGPTSIVSMNMAGESLVTLLTGNAEGDYWGPAWSPDGSRIAFTLTDGRQDTPDELALANADGSDLLVLTDNRQVNYLPAWSPDSRSILFVSQEINDEDLSSAELYRIDLDSGDVIALTDNEAPEYGASYSPDGARIVFGSERGGAWQIYTMNADGSTQAPLPTPAHGNAPSWSPDGSQIAFTSDRQGEGDIWVMNADGSGQRNLTKGLGNADGWDNNPRWSPDGRRIAYNSWVDGIATIMIYEMAEGRAYELHERGLFDAIIPSWSPDGLSLVFAAAEVLE